MQAVPETRIVSHHVGGRGFEVAFKYPFKYRAGIVHVLYEADKGCAEQMIATNDHTGLYIAPFCLGEKDGEGVLNITANPFFSSLLEPDPEFLNVTCEVDLSGAVDGVPVRGVRYDALYRSEIEVVRRIPVTIRSLDSLVRAGELPFKGLPDFLSLDTQGTEFEILKGAEDTIRRGVVAFSSEVEFRPMYKGQKLFSSILDFAVANGFEFAGFTYLQDVASVRLPVGMRGREQTAFGDALFYKRLDVIKREASSPEHLQTMALKLAFIAICFEHMDIAVTALRTAFAKPLPSNLYDAFRKHTYFRFLEDIAKADREARPIYLHSDRHAIATEIKAKRLEPSSRRLKAALGAWFGMTAPFRPTSAFERMLKRETFFKEAAIVERRRREAERYIPGQIRHHEPSARLWTAMQFFYKFYPIRVTYRFLRKLVSH